MFEAMIAQANAETTPYSAATLSARTVQKQNYYDNLLNDSMLWNVLRRRQGYAVSGDNGFCAKVF